MSGWLTDAYIARAKAEREDKPRARGKRVAQPALRVSNGGAQPDVTVGRVAQPKRDRAEYYRKYRAREKVCPHCGGKI
jgi:hypothetical protein